MAEGLAAADGWKVGIEADGVWAAGALAVLAGVTMACLWGDCALFLRFLSWLTCACLEATRCDFLGMFYSNPVALPSSIRHVTLFVSWLIILPLISPAHRAYLPIDMFHKPLGSPAPSPGPFAYRTGIFAKFRSPGHYYLRLNRVGLVLGSGVCLFVGLAHVLAGKVGIYLGRGDIGMPQ